MNWKAITEKELREYIDECCGNMTEEQLRIWEVIKVPLKKWTQEPWGNEGGGFWVVAIIGNVVIWFNDIEYGFNSSEFTDYGKIDQYYCDQGGLEGPVQDVLDTILGNSKPAGSFGAPQSLS